MAYYICDQVDGCGQLMFLTDYKIYFHKFIAK